MLPKQVKDKLNLRTNWYNLPAELNRKLKQLKQEKPTCYESIIPKNFRVYWFNLPNSISRICSLIDCEVTEDFNFYLRISGTDMYDNYGIENEATFVSCLDGQGATNIAVTDFYLSADTLRCNLSFDGATELYFFYFGISKIINLDSLVNLSSLDLSSNQLTKIENLDYLVNLTYLDLRINQLTIIENLDSLVNLITLYLSGNQLTTIENLETLVNLNTLDLNYNQITTIENLDSLVNLTYLDLSGNQLTTIENLDSLVNLTYLILSYNQLTTSEFNKLNSWAILAQNNGTIQALNNTDNFNLSTTYTTLLAKGWTIYT